MANRCGGRTRKAVAEMMIITTEIYLSAQHQIQLPYSYCAPPPGTYVNTTMKYINLAAVTFRWTIQQTLHLVTRVVPAEISNQLGVFRTTDGIDGVLNTMVDNRATSKR